MTEEDKERRLTEQEAKLTEIKNLVKLEESKKKLEPKIKIPILNGNSKPKREKPKYSRQARTPEEFLQIAKKNNYKIGWVAFRSLEFAESYDDCLHIAKVCNYKPGWAKYKWAEIQEAKAEQMYG